RLRMREVEAQAVRSDERALLRDMGSQHLTQCLVNEMRCRVVGANSRAAGVIDLELDRVADAELAPLDHAVMDEEVAKLLLRIGHAEHCSVRTTDHAGITHLPAGLTIERRLIEDEGTLVARLEQFGAAGILDDTA